MKKILLLLALIVSLPALSQTVNVTFMVNMENEETSIDGVYLAGGGTFGLPGDNPMADPEMDDVWTITVSLEQGVGTYYTFTNGICPVNWECKEMLAGLSCGDPSNFNDRYLPPVMSDTTLMTCFGQCSTDGACGAVADPVDVTFKVDMSDEVVGGAMYVTGFSVDGWCGTCVEMLDGDLDGVYEATVSLDPGDHEFKFNNGGWDGTEDLDPVEDGDCTLTTDIFTNRIISVPEGAPFVMDPVCFNSCAACIVGLNEDTTNEFKMYPSLADEFTMIRFSTSISDIRTIEVYSATGVLALKEQCSGSEANYRLDLSSLVSGNYVVQISSQGTSYTERLSVLR